MKRLLPLLMALVMLLSACGEPAENTKPSETQNTQNSTTSTTASQPNESTAGATNPSSSTATTPSTAPSQPELKYQNPLTGEALEEPMLQRPVAVMLNNIKAAMPQHGVSQADILYEVLAEGGITRCLGIFTDLVSVEKIGSIRSARKYYVDLARGYGAAYVHAGGSGESKDYLTGLKGMDLDAGLSATHFYRDQDRLNAGASLEHTLFSSGEKILSYAAQCGVSTKLSEEKQFGMTFDDGKVIVGKNANKVTVYFNMGGKPGAYTKSTAFTYDAATKLYRAAQHGGDYIDGNTKETVAFRNILVLYAATSVQPGTGGLLTVNTTGTGTGHFVCNGQTVNIKWSRKSLTEPFAFTLENGSPVTFGVGATYIGIVPTGATVTVE